MSQPEYSPPSLKGLRLYMRYQRMFPRYLSISVLFSISIALQNIIVPLLVALALGQLIHDHTINIGLLIFTGIFQFSMLAFSYLADIYGISLLHLNLEKKLYADCFEYLVGQDYSFFTNRFSGSIVTQASRFAKVYTVFNDTVFFDLLPQFIGIIIAISIMCYYSLAFGLIVLAVWLLSLAVVVKFALQRLPLRRGAVDEESRQIGELADVINNSLTVKTFAAEDRESRRYDVINQFRGSLFLKSWHRAVRNVWVIEVLCAVLQLVVLASGLVAVKHNTIGIATFLLFQVYVLRIIDNIKRSSFMVRQFEAAAGDSQEMAELLEQSPLVLNRPSAEPSRISKGAISFDAMSFHYQDSGRANQLFTNFNLDIKPSEKIGLVGPSGGGKTTLTRLLLRFMDIQDGSIKIDGQDLRDIKQRDLRRAIAYVPQEPLLFHRSIKENISYAKPDASDAEIIDVARKAYAHDFISELPEAYDTLVGERGVKLSGGQRQRVAIARAMLSGAPILILDEATSALDSESEHLIQKALRELMKHKTAVVIAHRLSTIQRMDRIIVVDKGQIVESGSHKQLIADKGLYAKLWSHQSGGFIEQ